MSYSRSDWGRLVLRLAVGGLMLFHGIAKLRGHPGSMDGIEEMLAAKGLPAAMAYGVYVGEIVAPLMLIVGFMTTIAALVFAFNMLVAIYLAHANDVFRLGAHGEWLIELPAFYFLAALAILLLGPGEIAFRGGGGGKRR